MSTALDLSLGAVEIGIAIGTLCVLMCMKIRRWRADGPDCISLLGITVMQAYQYFRKFNDPWPVQVTVSCSHSTSHMSAWI